MALPDYTEFLDPLELPIRGKKYRIPPMSFEDGLRVAPLLEGTVPDGLTDDDFARILLGSALDEMRADAVPEDAINRAMMTALSEYKYGRAAAEIMWKTGGDPKAAEALVQQLVQAANRESRRKAQKQSPSTGAAGTTKRRASTSSTKASPKK